MYRMHLLYIWTSASQQDKHINDSRLKQRDVIPSFRFLSCDVKKQSWVLGFNVQTCCATSAWWLIRVQVWWSRGGMRERERERERQTKKEKVGLVTTAAADSCIGWGPKSKEQYNLYSLLKSTIQLSFTWYYMHIISVHCVQSTCVYTSVPVYLLPFAHTIKQLWCNVSLLDSLWVLLFFLFFQCLIVVLTGSHLITKWVLFAQRCY